MKKFVKDNWLYMLLIAIIFFILYRLFDNSSSTKLLKEELKKIEVQIDSLLSAERNLTISIDSLNNLNTSIKKQRDVWLYRYNKTKQSIRQKIKDDENKINNINNIAIDSIDRILTEYKYKPFKRAEN